MLTLAIIANVDDRGQRVFERLGRVPVTGQGWRHQSHRALVWAVAMNACFAAFFTIPIVLLRIVFLGDNVVVP